MGAIHFSVDPQLLALLRKTTQAELFVETGTFEGDSLKSASELFDECYSVELSESYHRKAKERFATNPGIAVALGPSPEFLKINQAKFRSRPTVFWLDAHWCAAEHTDADAGQSPLMQELLALGSLHPQSTILIDDARLYLAPPPAPHRVSEWPDFHGVVTTLLQLGPSHRVMVLNDVVIFHPETAAEALRAFAAENGIDYQLQALRAPELLPSNKHLVRQAASYHELYTRYRKGWYPWILNPLAWAARRQRDAIRRRISRNQG